MDSEKGNPSRFSTSIASQIQSDINRSCEGRTGTWKSNSTRSVFNSVAKWDILPAIVQIVGTRDDSGINLKRTFGSFVGMTGNRDVSSPVLTTTSQQEIVQHFRFQHVSRARCNLADSLWSLWNSSFSFGVISLRCQVQNTVVLLGLRRNHSQFHLLLQRSNAHFGQC